MKKINELLSEYASSFMYFYKSLGYRVFVAVGLSIAIGIMDGFGLSMFLPLLQMISDAGNVDPENLGRLRFLVDGLSAMGLSLTLSVVLSVMVIFFALKGVAKFASFAYRVHVQQLFVRKIRFKMLRALNAISFKNFVTADVGKIQNTMGGEVDRVAKAYTAYFASLQQFILMVVYMGFALFVDPQFALLVTVGGALSNFLYRGIYKKTKVASRKLTADTHDYQGLIIQHVGNYKYLKATGLLGRYAEKLFSSILKIEHNNKRIGILSALLQSAREPIMILVVAIVIMVQARVLGGDLGAVMISLLFFYRALAALLYLQDRWNVFLGSSGSLENMTEFQQELEDMRGRKGGEGLEDFRDALELKNARFAYTSTPVLDNINLKVRKNESVALVGESGSGKTSLVNVLAGLIPLDEGSFFIDGKDALGIDMDSFQSKVGYITQDPVIFNDSIFNNITFWEEKNPESLGRFHEALKQAAAYDFVYSLPEKEETALGNNGINLSGGQKQRLSLARELYKKAEILILDEATSALDTETERAIQDNLDQLKGKFTLLIIAHRLSTVRNVDRVILMDKGQIKDEGSFSELAKRNERFKRMVELQEV